MRLERNWVVWQGQQLHYSTDWQYTLCSVYIPAGARWHNETGARYLCSKCTLLI